jgi:hypothetical protein
MQESLKMGSFNFFSLLLLARTGAVLGKRQGIWEPLKNINFLTFMRML